eukprot:CAMPEP_0184670936 /NCGR_PEP_ID=MMETSP0308-20130426/84649_1 /TAXON_ID=38269 /ORGANISM="Gloeochaete witrockiana, Strain SAG 46.84" /LENGTH=88 /DNA_ID=CAMNT_0027117897 /DNA_START=9 /DNA_END=272 /DNA_ORIENTATION=-
MKQHANVADVQEYGSKALANLQCPALASLQCPSPGIQQAAEGGAANEASDNGAGALGRDGRGTVVRVTTTPTAAEAPLIVSSSTQPRG